MNLLAQQRPAKFFDTPTIPKPGPTPLSVVATALAQSINLLATGWPASIQVWSGSIATIPSQADTKISAITPK